MAILAMSGERCLEVENQYVLLVRWQKIEAHTVGLGKSLEDQKWRLLLHHFYQPFPSVEHYERVASNGV